MIQTAEGSLNEAHAITQRIRELAVQSANDTNVAEDRTALQNEATELVAELGRIKDTTQFNKQNLLDATAGDGAGAVVLQVGANETEVMNLDFTTKGIDLTDIVDTDLAALDISTDSATAQAAITTLDTALEDISAGRSKLGAWQNRLEHTVKNLDNTAENLQASESRIRDVDMAKEMMNFTKNNILQQAAQSMLAQANQAPQGVLQLLR
jgi:flagellin